MIDQLTAHDRIELLARAQDAWDRAPQNTMRAVFEWRGVWFSILQGQSLSGASFTSLKQLQEHIDAYIKAYNDKAEPFVWTKKKVRQRRFKGRRITQL